MQTILDWLGATADALIWMVVLGVATAMVAGTARRVLGVRVGWPRLILVCVVAIITLVSVSSNVLVDPANPTHEIAPALWVYLGVATLWTFAIAAAVLVVLEIMVPTGSLPTVRSLVFGWGRRWRRGRRYAEVMGIAARHGLGAQLRGVRTPDPDSSRTAVSLRRALQEAGVTFTKLGQMLSTRADLLPAAYVVELTRLTNRAEPEPWSAVRAVLEGELGRPVTADLEAGRLGVNVRVLADEGDRAFVFGLVQQLVVAVLSGSAVLGGILLATSGGVEVLPGVTANALLGGLLSFAGFVLALRAVAQVFGRASG